MALLKSHRRTTTKLQTNHPNLILKDGKRNFNEAEKITIYRRDKGLCQICLKEGKKEVEAADSWSEYDADHIKAWILGGKTIIEQVQVLCRYHNLRKSANPSPGDY